MSKFQKYFTNLGIDVTKILDHGKFAGCSYIGQFPGARVVGDDIRFRDAAVDVFYQPNPNRELGHSHYFSVFTMYNAKIYIANADYVTKLQFHGIQDSVGDILYARYQHDFRYTISNEYGVDGGAWIKDKDTGLWSMWGRTIGSFHKMPASCTLMVKDDRLVIV